MQLDFALKSSHSKEGDSESQCLDACAFLEEKSKWGGLCTIQVRKLSHSDQCFHLVSVLHMLSQNCQLNTCLKNVVTSGFVGKFRNGEAVRRLAPGPVLALSSPGPTMFIWKWDGPFPYCLFSCFHSSLKWSPLGMSQVICMIGSNRRLSEQSSLKFSCWPRLLPHWTLSILKKSAGMQALGLLQEHLAACYGLPATHFQWHSARGLHLDLPSSWVLAVLSRPKSSLYIYVYISKLDSDHGLCFNLVLSLTPAHLSCEYITFHGPLNLEVNTGLKPPDTWSGMLPPLPNDVPVFAPVF